MSDKVGDKKKKVSLDFIRKAKNKSAKKKEGEGVGPWHIIKMFFISGNACVRKVLCGGKDEDEKSRKQL